ncbi:MAG: CoA pyrophosphatase [Nakamurella sp.]
MPMTPDRPMDVPFDEMDEQLDGAAVALVGDDDVPAWLRPMIRRSLGGPLPGMLDRAARRREGGSRQSAVLMLLSDGVPGGVSGGGAHSGPDLLLTQRASTMRTHAGQPAFPGGALDRGEDAVAAALREGFEETGVDPASVTPLVLMPRLYLPRSEFVVQPVLAYWHTPGPVAPVDPAETELVARVPIAALAAPAHRLHVSWGSYVGPAFEVADMLVWGFTAAIIDALLDLGGWNRPWEFPDTRTVDVTDA